VDRLERLPVGIKADFHIRNKRMPRFKLNVPDEIIAFDLYGRRSNDGASASVDDIAPWNLDGRCGEKAGDLVLKSQPV
jgi:hypothetical protein